MDEIRVRWADACNAEDDMPERKIDTLKTLIMTSVGFLLRQEQDKIIIAGTFSH